MQDILIFYVRRFFSCIFYCLQWTSLTLLFLLSPCLNSLINLPLGSSFSLFNLLSQQESGSAFAQEADSSLASKQSSDPAPKPKFFFGSYGRVGMSSNEQGGEGQRHQVTAYAPRLIEDNYLELDFGYHAYRGSHAQVDVITTVSAFDHFFHYNGQADAQLAIRRAYVEARKIGGSDLWASLGSRLASW